MGARHVDRFSHVRLSCYERALCISALVCDRHTRLYPLSEVAAHSQSCKLQLRECRLPKSMCSLDHSIPYADLRAHYMEAVHAFPHETGAIVDLLISQSDVDPIGAIRREAARQARKRTATDDERKDDDDEVSSFASADTDASMRESAPEETATSSSHPHRRKSARTSR
jgi:hypothetical protein